MGDYIDLPNDDPKCPRIHLALRLDGDRVTRLDARNRLSIPQRDRLADRIPFRIGLTKQDKEKLLDQIAALLVRLDKVPLRKKAPKNKNSIPKKQAKRSRIPTAAAVERAATSDILRNVRGLHRQLKRASGRVRKRLQFELADPASSARRSDGELAYISYLSELETLESAITRSLARIEVAQGSDIGRPARSVVEQLASLWLKATGTEATAGPKSRPGRFEPFVHAFFHNVPRYYFLTAKMIERVVKDRAAEKRYKHSQRDSESDN